MISGIRMSLYWFELQFMSLMDACATNGSNGGGPEAYGMVVWWYQDGDGGEARKNKILWSAWWEVGIRWRIAGGCNNVKAMHQYGSVVEESKLIWNKWMMRMWRRFWWSSCWRWRHLGQWEVINGIWQWWWLEQIEIKKVSYVSMEEILQLRIRWAIFFFKMGSWYYMDKEGL